MPASEYSMDADRTADVRTHNETPFDAFVGDRPELLRGLTDCGYENASPVQVAALPVIIAGNDAIVEAKNGTGKTLTFVVPALMRLKPDQSCLQSVVLAPTREIAVQIQQCFKKVGQHLPKLKCEYFIGGTPVDEDRQKAIGCQIAVGSPGRIKHLLNEHVLNGLKVKIFVLDEVDRLFSDNNFTKDIRLINAKFPKIKQTVAVSASIDKKDMSLFDEFMQEYSLVKGSEEDMNASEDPSKFLLGIKQYVACVRAVSTNIILLPAKNVRLLNILKNLPYTQCIVFTNYMTRVEAVCNMLRDHNYKADYIRGDQDQIIRLKLVDRLTTFKSRILVATDLIARGIDSSNVDLVINMDCPHDWATYLHRIGRAGRFGNKGNAFTILDDDKELKTFKRIINNIENVKVKILPIVIAKPILEYTDGELDDLDLTLEPNGVEENGKETAQGDSESKPKEPECDTSHPIVDEKQEEIVNKSTGVPHWSEEDSLRKLRRIVQETEKRLIDNDMINKKYLNSDRTFVLFNPEPLLSDTDFEFSPQELITIMSKYNKKVDNFETEQNTVSEKSEHKKNPHPPFSFCNENDPLCADYFDRNVSDMDTSLNTDEEVQNLFVPRNGSEIVDYVCGSWTKEEFKNKTTDVANVSSCKPECTNGSLEDDIRCETETKTKIDKPRFTNVYDLFQIPDFSLLKTANRDSPESPSNGTTSDVYSFSSYYQKVDTENSIELCEEESDYEEVSETAEVSESEEESMIEVSDFEVEQGEKIDWDFKRTADEREEGNDNEGTFNVTYENNNWRENGSAKPVDESVQTRAIRGSQYSSGERRQSGLVRPRTENNQQLVDYDVLNDWYGEWRRQLSVIQTYISMSK